MKVGDSVAHSVPQGTFEGSPASDTGLSPDESHCQSGQAKALMCSAQVPLLKGKMVAFWAAGGVRDC